MAVRYDRKFLAEMDKIIRSYNSKITRLSRSNKGYTLPEKFSNEALASLKQTAKTRTEVRRRLKDLQSFTARGGEKNIQIKGNVVPRYLHTNIKRYQRILKYKTTRRINELETRKPRINGKEEPFTFSQYGSGEYLTLKAKQKALLNKDVSKMTQGELKAYLNQLISNTKEKDLKLWQNNYLDMLKDTALSYGYDEEKLEVIIERLEKLTPEQFDDLSFVDRNIKDVIYKYKALESIQTEKELADVSEDVFSNLDSIYENLDDILKAYE